MRWQFQINSFDVNCIKKGFLGKKGKQEDPSINKPLRVGILKQKHMNKIVGQQFIKTLRNAMRLY